MRNSAEGTTEMAQGTAESMTHPVHRAWLSMKNRPVSRVNPVQIPKQQTKFTSMGFL